MGSHLAEDEDIGQVGATEQLLQSLRQTDSNEEFLNSMPGANAQPQRYFKD
jgi:transcription termination factor Rho